MSDQAMGIRLENAEAEVEHLKALCDSYEATVQRLEAEIADSDALVASQAAELHRLDHADGRECELCVSRINRLDGMNEQLNRDAWDAKRDLRTLCEEVSRLGRSEKITKADLRHLKDSEEGQVEINMEKDDRISALETGTSSPTKPTGRVR